MVERAGRREAVKREGQTLDPAADALAADARVRAIFEHSNDAIFVLDAEADAIVDANPRACRMLGYRRDELLALPISTVHPEEMPHFLAFARSVLETGSGWTNELACLTRTGERLPAEVSASVVEMAGRRSVVAMVRDISDRKRAEAALRHYSERLAQLVEERTAELRRSEQRQRALLAISNAVAANLDRAGLFEAIAGALRQVLPFDRASVTLYDAQRDVLSVYALAGPSATHAFPLGTELSRRGSHLEAVVGEQRAVLCRDLGSEIRSPTADLLFREGLRSYVAAPLVTKGKVLGTLNVGSETTSRYDEEDARFVGEIATQVAPAVDNMLAYEEIARLKARLEEENVYLREEIKTQHNFEELVGQSPALRRVLKAVETVAPTDTPVLILGETGTGKELVARALHDLSGRRRKPLVKVNCAAFPAGLFESRAAARAERVTAGPRRPPA